MTKVSVRVFDRQTGEAETVELELLESSSPLIYYNGNVCKAQWTYGGTVDIETVGKHEVMVTIEEG